VFAGPTLHGVEPRVELDAEYLPPAIAGDVYRVALRRPAAIGIVDGPIERAPAVWHKEILWAMSRGIQVFGSAGVGALRAVELAAFGMQGVGRIFEAFEDGTLEDDDEVAVAYGPPEAGYRSSSAAMVDIRATLASAEVEGVIGPVTRTALERIGKGLHYAQRAYTTLLEHAGAAALPAGELAALRDWLPGGRVELKQRDALAMLRAMRQQTGNVEERRVEFELERTTNWEKAIRYWDGSP
jgi:hypothetical protein